MCPDNTAHIALEADGEPFPIPCLHIGEVVADQAQRDGRRKVGILGTKWTMTGPVYPGALGRRGIAWAIPDEADRKIIDDIIFGELCLGVFTDESREPTSALSTSSRSRAAMLSRSFARRSRC